MDLSELNVYEYTTIKNGNEMKRLVFISNWFYLFSLCLWVGGMFLLGILVEIMVRINLKEQPQIASTIMNKVMDVFNINIIYTCITCIVLAEVIKFLVARYGSSGYQPQVVTKFKYTRYSGIICIKYIE